MAWSANAFCVITESQWNNKPSLIMKLKIKIVKLEKNKRLYIFMI